jgi:hypothetical protein
LTIVLSGPPRAQDLSTRPSRPEECGCRTLLSTCRTKPLTPKLQQARASGSRQVCSRKPLTPKLQQARASGSRQALLQEATYAQAPASQSVRLSSGSAPGSHLRPSSSKPVRQALVSLRPAPVRPASGTRIRHQDEVSEDLGSRAAERIGRDADRYRETVMEPMNW